MTLKQITALGRELIPFLALFSDCFGRIEARELLRVYVKGQLSNLHRKTAEAIALRFDTAPRTLQRFLESVKWAEEKLRDRCQTVVAEQHAHPDAIGCIDESGTTKSGQHTTGAARQYNGNRGKIDNCVVAVHISYAIPTGFQVLLDSTLYLPEAWANDPARRKKLHSRRYQIPYQARHRLGSNRRCRGQRRGGVGLDVRLVVRARLQVFRWHGIAWTMLCGRDPLRLSWLGAKAQGVAECCQKPAKTWTQQAISTRSWWPADLRSPQLVEVFLRVSATSLATLSHQGHPQRS